MKHIQPELALPARANFHHAEHSSRPLQHALKWCTHRERPGFMGFRWFLYGFTRVLVV